MKRPPTKASSSRFFLMVSAGALLLGFLSFVIWRIGQFRSQYSVRSTPHSALGDPRLTFPTPYRNVRPGIHYVGESACAECHADVAATYRLHPMGRSLAPVSEAAAVERYDQAARNPFEKDGFQFLVERQDGHVFHREFLRDSQGRTVQTYAAEIGFAIGSGTRGRSYLIDREGYVFQSLVSWYSQPGVWDLTPGVQIREQFERPAEPSCLFCHSNQVEPVAGTVNRYQQPVFRGHS